MEEQTPARPNIKFLSFSNDKEDAEKEAKLKEAAAKIERAIARERTLNELVDYSVPESQDEIVNLEKDTRSLYERLQEQRNKKRESIEEAQKLSNFVAHLDEDDANYLNEVAKNRREEELRKRLEVQDALEAKKRLDEQKMLNDEKLIRASLMGNYGKETKTLKSRFSSMIKVKPKAKGESDPTGAKDINNRQSEFAPDASTSLKRSSGAVEQPGGQPPSKRSTNQRSKDDDLTSHEDPSEDSKGNPDTQQRQCTCVKNVTQVLGIMPASLIVKENPRDGDDSDQSDDDSVCKLMPEVRRNRR